MVPRHIRNWMALVFFTLFLAACGGGGGGSGGGNSSGSGGGNSSGGRPSGSPTPTPLNYAVQLAWTAPSTRADGSPLTASDLSGYRVYYGLDTSSNQDTVITVDGGTTTSMRLTLSTAGTYVFTITAVDTSGLESSFSAPVSAAVN